jgi:hypothetical protein
MDSSKIKAIIIAILALFAALYLGIASATAQIETLMWVVGGSSFSICCVLGKRIWMILPFMGALNLTLMIPGQPSTLLLAHVVFIGFSSMLFLMRKLPSKPAFSELGLWVLLLTICVLQIYLRNPVGLNIIGGGSVGAKPYGLFGIALASSIILGSLRIPPLDLRWIIRLSILGGLIGFAMQVVGFFMPSIGVWYGAVAPGGVNESAIPTGEYGVNRATRIGFLGNAGRNLSLWIGTFISPMRACYHPLWAPIVLLSIAFAALSGFRNEIGAVGLTYVIALAYRGGSSSLLLSGFAMLIGLGLLALLNLAAPLPANIQRSLSFLPGTWDKEQAEDTENSTTWRVEMWQEALFTDSWIHNKLMGDGLGMSREEFNYIQSFQDVNLGGGVGSGKLTRQQEFMMASGNYHSGLVITIRAIGYTGLLIFVLAQIRLAVHAHRQIQRARNTEWFPLTLFIGIPLIWAPIFFIFVIGDFGPATTSFLLGAAFVRLLENNLPLPAWQSRRRLLENSRNNPMRPWDPVRESSPSGQLMPKA